MPKPAFEHCAEDYARYRPLYPPEAVTTLVDLFGGRRRGCVADIGAGTGIFSRQLAGAGWRVIAVEPSAAMLRQRGVRVRQSPFRGAPPIAPIIATAEATSLASGSVQLVTAAQAAHWFNPRYAFPEFARILAPGGGLALIWNNRVATEGSFVDRYENLVRRYNPAYRRDHNQQDWASKIDATGAFDDVQTGQWAWTWDVPAEYFAGFARSCSYIRNVISRVELPRFEAELGDLMAECFPDGRCQVPIRTDAWMATRR
jgi:SAM-dependent methyltransferase